MVEGDQPDGGECWVYRLRTGVAYRFELPLEIPEPREGADIQAFDFAGVRYTYNEAVVRHLSGEDAPELASLGRSRLTGGDYVSMGSITSFPDATKPPPTLLPPGVTVVVADDCASCPEVLEAIQAAEPDVPVQIVDLDDPMVASINATVAPSIAVSHQGVWRGDLWVGDSTAEDIDWIIAEACVGLADPAVCTQTPTARALSIQGLGTPCLPDSCEPNDVASWASAQYGWPLRDGLPGALGWLATGTSVPWSEEPGGRSATVGGVLRSVRIVEIPAASPPERAARTVVASFYFGESPITGEPVIGAFALGDELGLMPEIGLDCRLPWRPWHDWTVSPLMGWGFVDAPHLVSGSSPVIESTTYLDILIGTEGELRWSGTCPSLPPLSPGTAYRFGLHYEATTTQGLDPARAPYLSDRWEYNRALLMRIAGEEAGPLSGFGMISTWYAAQPHPVSLEPGVTITTEAGCALCDRVIEAIGAAEPDLPIHVIDAGSDLARSLFTATAFERITRPPAVAVAHHGVWRGDLWVGESALDDLDWVIDAACLGLDDPSTCQSSAFAIADLGPACRPGACDPDTVAAWPAAVYTYPEGFVQGGNLSGLDFSTNDPLGGGPTGVLGLLELNTRRTQQDPRSYVQGTVERPESTPPHRQLALVGGILRGITLEMIPELYPDSRTYVASFYFGDDPVTDEPILGEFALGSEAGTDTSMFLDCILMYRQQGGTGTYTVYLGGWAGPVPGKAVVTGIRPGKDGACEPSPLQPGVAYRLLVPYDLRPGYESRGIEYNEALLDRIQGTGPGPDGGLGLISEFLDAQTPPPIPLLPGITMVAGPDCSSCTDLAAAIREAAPNLPIHTVRPTSRIGRQLSPSVLPAAIVSDHGVWDRDVWLGQQAFADLSSLIAAACAGLDDSTTCD